MLIECGARWVQMPSDAHLVAHEPPGDDVRTGLLCVLLLPTRHPALQLSQCCSLTRFFACGLLHECSRDAVMGKGVKSIRLTGDHHSHWLYDRRAAFVSRAATVAALVQCRSHVMLAVQESTPNGNFCHCCRDPSCQRHMTQCGCVQASSDVQSRAWRHAASPRAGRLPPRADPQGC